MSQLSRITGWILLFLFPAFIAFLFGAALFGILGAAISVFFVLVTIGITALSAEERLIRFYSARVSGNRPYLRRRDQAIERVVRRLVPTPPRLFIIDSPESLLYVTRNAWGRGSIFISEGWISTQNENDLNAWLSFAVSETQRKELVLQTLSCHLADRFRKITPNSWIEFIVSSRLRSDGKTVSLKSIEMIWGLICLFIIQFLLSISNPRRRSLAGIFEETHQAIQKHAFCFNPLRVDSDEFRHEVNRHSLLIQEKLG